MPNKKHINTHNFDDYPLYVDGGDVLGGAASGAALGNTIGSLFPGPGNLIGTAAGALIGGTVSYVKSNNEEKAAEQAKQNRVQAINKANHNSQLTGSESLWGGPLDYTPMAFAGGEFLGPIEVEGDELEVHKGKILKDFKGKPSHDDGGYKYNAKSAGNKGDNHRMIIPANLRDEYKNSGKLKRQTIETSLKWNQKAREKEEAELQESVFFKGGKIRMNSAKKPDFEKAAKKRGVSTEEFTNKLFTSKSNSQALKFREGGEFELDDFEIKDLIAQGYELEYLD